MSTFALIVDVADTELGQRTEYVFARSPVRVGRSPLNELPLQHSFVSHCHGLLHFDQTHVAFVDVGSTNGTFLGGARLEKNRRVSLSPGTAVVIGALRLTARLEQRETRETRGSYAFPALRADEAAASRAERPSSAPATAAPSRSTANETHLTELCERFAQSFIELRRGQHQLLRDLGLKVPAGDKLHALHNPQELLAYLLEPSAFAERADELSRAYADLMTHEVAMVSAIGAGARELLDELSPNNLAPRGVGGIFGFLARLLGDDARWLMLQKKIDELREEAALSAVVLGRSFARAYSTALGKSGSSERPSSTGRDR